jgi:lipase chaperone LimK
MPARDDNARLVRRTAALGIVGLAVAIGAFVWIESTPQRGTGTPRVPSGKEHAGPGAIAPRKSAAPSVRPHDALPASGLPPPLVGSSAPRLPLDALGHLAKVRAVRDFFDYFLTAQNDLDAAQLDALVTRGVAAQLGGTVAQVEALDVWNRYRAYLGALAAQPDLGAPGKTDLGALQLVLDQRASIADRTLGDWSKPFFGTELDRQRFDLSRVSIERDDSLTDAQKRERLAALDAKMPADERADQRLSAQQRATIDQIALWQQSGATPDAMREQLARTLGTEVAERAARMQQDDASWQSRYSDYATQRARIEAGDLSPEERDARIAALRQHMFTKPGEAARAAAFDRGAGTAL